MVCPSCNQSNTETAQFCQFCGAAMASATAPGSGRPMTYGGFWIRAVALIIDWIVVITATGILMVITGGVAGIAGPILPWLYEALMLTSTKQATLGKIAVGLRVVGLDGAPISFGRATGRHFAKYVSALIMGIGFIMAAFTDKKQALHDMIAGTLVRS